MDNIEGCGYGHWETSDSEDDDTVDVSNDDKLEGARHPCVNGEDAKSSGESESLSDIDDAEVNTYLNDDKEKHYKKIIWEKLNQKYLQEQEAKKCAATANVPKPKRRNRRAKGADKEQTTTEVAQPASNKKRTSSRVNYDVVSKFLDEPLSSDNPKRSKTESGSDRNVVESSAGFQVSNGEDEENGWEENQDDYSYFNNQEEEYNYDFDDGLF